MPFCRDLFCTRRRLRARALLVVAVLASGPLLAGCTNVANMLNYGQNFERLNSAQRAAVDDVARVVGSTTTDQLVLYAQADRPELFGKTPADVAADPDLAGRKSTLDSRRAMDNMYASLGASQTKISAQATLNPPSADNGVDPTALDSRRNEAAFGHPQF